MSFRKRFSREKLLATISKDSFYLVLFLCLVLLATTAVWVTRNNIKFLSEKDIYPEENQIQEEYQVEELPIEEGKQAASMDKNQEETKEFKEESKPMEEEGKTETQAKEQNITEKNEQPKVVAASNPQKPSVKHERMIMPVVGKIIMDYGKDKLVYSNTLEQWTTHYGIDIASGVGTPVKAVMSGTVTEINTDPKLGIMITIDHDNGITTRYANLQNNNMVKVGQRVEKGKIISGVGTTAEFEIGDEPHLHFEVLKNGEHQDPKLYLPNM
jgi:murein DD-endopeptidase MepM/ murein hydrolase activator NlpD